MTLERFEEAAAEAFEKIPEKFRKQMKNVALLVESEPDEETLREEGLEEGGTLLGLYRGIPNTERGAYYGVGPTLPDTITLYQLPIEEEAEFSQKSIEQVLYETLWHEIAHYFGFDEGSVREEEGKRFN
ncbi:metallopeptidase family protein [Candidatus Parcubacteria bacterium]|nr:metallopeptidase family protein [Candidatus Parcubacteria bacterium]